MALTSGNVTITISGEQRAIGQKIRTCKVVIASSGMGASGIPLPATPNDWGLKSRLDYLEIIDQDSALPHVLNIDYAQTTASASAKAILQILKPILASGTGSTLATMGSGDTVSGITMYVRAHGF